MSISLLLAVFIILYLPAPAHEAEEGGTVHRTPSVRLEVPDDEYVPVPSEMRVTSPAHRSQTPGFFYAQVNVDILGDNIIGDAANEPSIAVDPTDPSRMAIGWRQFDTINSNFRQAGWGYTTDGGQTWTFPGVIEPGIFRSDPVLDSDLEGNFYYNSLTSNVEDMWCNVFKSTNGGATWDSGTFAQGGDKQWMAIDRTGGIGNGNIYAYWVYAYSICPPGYFTRSIDGGASYEDCITIPDDPFWGTLTVGPDGELYTCGANFVVAKSTNAQDPGQSVSWDFSSYVDLDGDIQVGEGPNPGGLLGQVWITVDHSTGPSRGNVYLLCSVDRYSTNDSLDVMFASSTDGGLSWSPPVQVNDDPDDTAWQWFGTMSVAPDGRIDVIWLDTRDDPGGFDSALYYSYSRDAGATWSSNKRLSDSFDPHVGWPQQQKMGDYFDMVSDSTGAHLAWAATFNGEQDVYYGHILPDIHVPDDYATIQEAIDAAVDGNTIIVSPGTYHEHDIDFLGKAITVTSTDPEDSTIVATTVIDADSLGSVFVFQSGEDSTSVLTGLTTLGGLATFGGGISCSNSSPLISNNHISDNMAAGTHPEGQGGGIYCYNSSPIISNNMITGNSANAGGGIYCSDSCPSILNNNFVGNTAMLGGGGVGCSNSSPTITNNTVTGNSAALGSAGGGGIACTASSSATVTNTILWDNESAEGPEIWIGNTSTLTIGYSDVEGGENSVFVEAGSTLDWGDGMIDTNPLFRDLVSDDYHLMAVACGDSSDSPCIDAGDPGITDLVLGCSSGLGTTRSDMGAYGGGEVTVSVDDEDTNPNFPSLPRAFSLAQNYPNPFNPSTTISFDLAGTAGTSQPVTLNIHDIRGRKVKTLIDSDLEPGRHSVVWDGRNDSGGNVSSGIYLYTLRSEGNHHTRKMIVLK
jgi:hypothetical protein